MGENLFCDGLDLLVGDLQEVFSGFLRGGDMVVEKQALAGPGCVGGGGFEGELGLGNGEALRAFEFPRGGAVGGDVFGYFEHGFEGFVAGIGIEAGDDVEGSGFVKKRGFAADLVAEAALFAELVEESGGGGFAEDEGEQAEGVAFIRMTAGGMPGQSELELISGAALDDLAGR